MNSEDGRWDHQAMDERCPVSGLAIRQKPEWKDVNLGPGLRVSVRVIGNRILHVRPSGYGTKPFAMEVMDLTARVIEEQFEPEKRYVQIEDYADYRGATLDARRVFIRGMKARHRMKAVIFCTTSPIFKVSIRLGKRLTPSDIQVHIVGTYEEAVEKALQELSQREERPPAPVLNPFGGDTPSPKRDHVSAERPTRYHVKEKTTEEDASLLVGESRDAWALHLDGFSIRYEQLDKDVVHTRSEGYLEERHIEPFFRHMKDVLHSMGLLGRPFFLVNGLEGVSGTAWRARRAFARKVSEVHGSFPFRLNVFYGGNPLLKAAIRLGRPFVPFPVHLAGDLNDALRAVEDSRLKSGGSWGREEAAERSGALPATGLTRASIEELLQFLGSIDWERSGREALPREIEDASHPLHPVFEAFSLIKSDVDQLLEEREGALNALEIEQAYLRQLFESSQVAMARASDDSRLQQVNPAFTRVFGYAPAEAIGRNVDDLIVPEEMRESAETMTRRVEQGEKVSFETVRRHKDGTAIAVEVLAFPITVGEQRVGAYSMYLDIRERVDAETALRASQEKLQDLFENVSDLLYVHDMEGRFLETNRAFQELAGLSAEEALRLNVRDLMPEENRPGFDEYLERIRAQGADEGFFRLLDRSGRSRLVEYKNSLITDEDGSALGVRGSARDLTDRVRAERALRESEARHRNILENMNEGYYEVDLAGNFTFVNQAMSAVLGYPKEELIGMNNRAYMDEENARKVYETFNRVYRSGRPDEGFDWETVRKDGSRCIVETSVSLIVNAKGEPVGFRGLLRDVTDREQARKERVTLEAQLQHAQRMEAIGTLAGGIAHNFNNLLMGIQGNASLMTLDLDPDHPHFERLKTIEKLVKSGSELTGQLLGYAREGRYEVRSIDLNDLVRKTAGTFGAARKEIRIHMDLPSSLRAVLADRGQIEQALMNLFVNAGDAMPQGGDLHLTTRNVASDSLTNKPYVPKAGDYVLLEVRDTGMGMDEETRDKIFEPFFTTKGLSKGTGLGLASVYGTVKAHGGYIDVSSHVGRGTLFEVYLPATGAPVERAQEQEGTIESGSGTVLLVDDEPIVLDVGADMLSGMRYTVHRAESGEEAIRLFQEARGEIDLVVLDMIMPDMGGGEVFDRLREIDPGVKVLLASGYSMDGKAAEILRRGCDDFIQKPFDMRVLSQKVRNLLLKNA